MTTVFDRLYKTQTESSRAKRRAGAPPPPVASGYKATTTTPASPPPIKTQLTNQSPGSPTGSGEDPTETTAHTLEEMIDEHDVMLASVLQDDDDSNKKTDA